LPKERDFHLILAGGLNPLNVAEAVETARPDMVDVSGGVESSRGIKDEQKVQAFINNAKAVAEG
jgi:phosphoribosylanthranilate isomerase